MTAGAKRKFTRRTLIVPASLRGNKKHARQSVIRKLHLWRSSKNGPLVNPSLGYSHQAAAAQHLIRRICNKRPIESVIWCQIS